MRKSPMTFGLTHLAVAVKDLQATTDFYCAVFDMEVMYDEDDFVQLTTPGTKDILVFEKSSKATGRSGNIAHFGFRLRNPRDIRLMEKRIVRAGGILTGKGEFLPGFPYIFFKDPDGYEVEVWYEQLPKHLK